MNKKQLLSTIPAGILLAGCAWMVAGLLQTAAVGKYEPRFGTETPYLAGPAEEYYNMLRTNVNTGNIEPADWFNAYNATKEIQASGGRALGLQWQEQGPDNVGGRTRAILVDRNNPAIVYAGSVSGGLFKSLDYGNNWLQLTAFDQVFCISSITQGLDGTVYVGTGPVSTFNEFGASTNWGLSGTHTTGGMFYTTDGGASFTSAAGTTTMIFYEMQPNPLNGSEIYVATSSGVRKYSIANGLTTVHTSLNALCKDLQVSRDGMVLIANIGSKTWVSNDGAATWLDMTIAANTANPCSTISQRCEYAISYDKNTSGKYNIYLGGSDSNTYEAWWSIDNGNNWYKVSPNNQTFNPVGTQGNYNNICTHVPGYPGRVFLGGIDCYEFVQDPTNPITGQFYQRSFWFLQSPNPTYIHADNHEMTWDYVNNQLYVGNDGGVFKSVDRSFNIFYAANYGYNVTQFYSVAFSGKNEVMGGSQDNGTQYINHNQGSWKSAIEIRGGDGFDCDISQLNPDVFFASIYYGAVERSNTGGGFSDFFHPSMLTLGTPGDPGVGNFGFFHTTFRYAENENDQMSTDSLRWTPLPGEFAVAGDTIEVLSSTADFYFEYILTPADVAPFGDTLFNCIGFNCSPHDTITVKNPVQSMFALGLNPVGEHGLWLTRDAANFSHIPNWDSFPGVITGAIQCLEFSADCYVLYVGTSNGRVYKVSGLEYYYPGTGGYNRDSITVVDISGALGQAVTGIAVDAQDKNHIVVTLGNYGSTNIRECNNTAAVTPVFNMIDGNMPAMPVYDVVIDRLNSNHIIVGTEMGIYSTDNGGVTWTHESQGIGGTYGMGIVPVYALRQQHRPWSSYVKNPGVIYAGTHGRGIWSTATLLSAKPAEPTANKGVPGTLFIYPNPSADNSFAEVNMRSDAKSGTIFIYSLEGRLVSQTETGRLQKGKNQITLPLRSLSSGTYVIRIIAGEESYSGRAVVSK